MRGACKGNQVKRLITLAAALGAASPALAQDVPAVDTIIVTATRTEIPISDATVPVDVISRDQIELSMAADLAELLRFEAGVEIGRNGGPGQPASFFIRGTESNHTLVLMDGVRINPGTLGGAAIQNIAPQMIERIEIVKGTRSSLFGTDAIGGVINIITRRSQPNYGEASISAGSFDSRAGHFALGNASDAGEFGASVSFDDTSGFPTRTESDIDRGHDKLSLNLHGSLNLGSSTLGIRHWTAEGKTEYLDFFLTPLDQDFTNRTTALEWSTPIGDAANSRLILGHMTDDIAQNQSADFVESTRLSLDWHVTLPMGDHLLSGGVYLTDEDASSLSFGSGFDESTRTDAVYLQDQWSRDRHSVFIAARFTDHETFGSEPTWNAEYAFDINEQWTLTAGIGRAFRAPDATDRFGFGGSPDLNPEIADEAQFGIRYAPGGGHTLGLEVYDKDIDDLIEFDLATFQLRNIAKAEIRGAELSWSYRVEDYSIRASVIRQSAENPVDDIRLLRRAEESATLNVVRNFGVHRLGVSVLASGDREDFGGIKLPGYALVNLTGQLSIGDRWRLHGRVENLFDRDYETAAGFQMQGLSAFAELRYAWR